MRLPLLIGGRPPYVKWGATVPLARGEWEIKVIGLTDTIASLWSDRPPTRSPLPTKISGGRMVRVCIDEPGSEESISVYAEKIV